MKYESALHSLEDFFAGDLHIVVYRAPIGAGRLEEEEVDDTANGLASLTVEGNQTESSYQELADDSDRLRDDGRDQENDHGDTATSSDSPANVAESPSLESTSGSADAETPPVQPPPVDIKDYQQALTMVQERPDIHSFDALIGISIETRPLQSDDVAIRPPNANGFKGLVFAETKEGFSLETN